MTTHVERCRQFTARVERFLKRYDVAPSRLGRDAVNESSFVLRLRAGVLPRAETMDKVEDYMRDYKSRAATAATIQAAE